MVLITQAEGQQIASWLMSRASVFLAMAAFLYAVTGSWLPLRVQLIFMLAIACLLPTPEQTWLLLIGLGLAFGLLWRIAHAAMDGAASLVSQASGLSLANLYGVDGGRDSLTLLLGALAALFFLSADGLLLALVTFLGTLHMGAQVGGMWLVVHSGGVLLAQALYLALPMLSFLLFCQLALGLAARFAPAFHLFNVGLVLLPLLAWLGLWWALPQWQQALWDSFAALQLIHRN